MRPRLLAVLAAVALASSAAAGPEGAPKVLEHDVLVHLHPKRHLLEAADRITVEAAAAGTMTIDLAPKLAIVEVEVGGKVRERPQRAEDGSFAVDVPAGKNVVRVRYAGEVFDAVTKADDLSWVVGDHTTGIVSEKGIFLSPASRWVPTPRDGGLTHFHVTSYVPAPFLVVTQGTVPTREEKDGWRKSVARSVIPTDGLTLVAGPWTEKARDVEGVRIATYFLESEAAAADLWLDQTEAVVKRYAPILGKYPHAKFDVVENFFDTGYGEVSFTLLGQSVIQYVTETAKRQGGKIPPGYVDHEYVHGWFGNGLFVDYATGNWCEAITTYFSNYLAKELESKAEGRAHRRGVLEKWSLRARGEKDYPLRKFVGKTEEVDNDVGYGKGSMWFHLARKEMGDERFFDAVREFTQARVGTVVSWDDWMAAFSKASGQDMKAHLGPYLERKGLPEIQTVLVTISSTHGDQGSSLSVKLPAADGGGPWPLFLPVRFDGVAEDQRDQVLDVSSGTARLGIPHGATAATLDPDYDVLRRIADADLPPCLNRTLEQPGGVIVWRGAEAIFKPLAEQIAAQKGFRVEKPDFDVDAFDGSALILEIGDPAKGVTVAGQKYSDPAVAALVSTAQGKRLHTRYTALSEAAAERARRITYYGWDPYVVFQNGRPISRDPRQNETPSTRHVLAAAGPSDAAKRIRADVDRLASLEFEGRRPGTEGHAKAEAFLRKGLEGLDPVFSETGEMTGRFAVGVPRRLSSRDFVVTKDGKEEIWKDAFWPLPWQGAPVDIVWSSKSPRVEMVATGVIPVKAFADSLKTVFRGGAGPAGVAAATLEFPDEHVMSPFAPWLDTPGDLTPTSSAELSKRRSAPPPPLGPWISGRRQRLPTLPPTPFPILGVMKTTSQRLTEALAAGAEVRARVEFEPSPADNGHNLGGMLLAEGAPGSRDVVILSAHYDAQGKDEGGLYLGADDNGSGDACLLEVLRDLAKEWRAKKDRKVSLMVLFFDGEEWGLLGSRAFVKELEGKNLHVKAVVNVDAIGRAVTKPTHLVGLSTHPALAKAIQRRLEEQGLSIGKDIDQYAYAEGSDHWPFHEAGIPAVTIWASDYTTMNTTEDTPEKVEPEGVAKIAAALRRLVLEDLDSLAR